MPDNGFGTKANSADFLLRLYHVTPRLGDRRRRRRRRSRSARSSRCATRTARSPFPIVNERHARPAADRRRLRHRVGRPRAGRHVLDRRGVRPVPAARRRRPARCSRRRSPFPGGKSPQNPYLAAGRDAADRARSRGFEAMAGSADGRYLYPIVEGAFIDDPTSAAAYIYEFDTDDRRATPAAPGSYQTDTDGNVVGDAFTVERRPAAASSSATTSTAPPSVTKRIYADRPAPTPTPTASSTRTLVVDLLRHRQPRRHRRRPRSPGAYGVGRPVRVPDAVGRDGRPAARRPAAGRQRQQLPGQRRARARARRTTPR